MIKQDLMDLLSEDVFNKFKDALEKPVSQYDEDLNIELEDSVISKLRTFIADNDDALILAKIEAELSKLDKEIEARKDEPRPPRQKKPAAKKQKQSQTSDKSKESKDHSDASAEDLFKQMIRKIQGRIGAIKFSKNDYQTYSEVQSQLDLLLRDSSNEINQIKMSIQRKFERAQADAPAPRKNQNNQRQRRERRKRSPNEDQGESLFTKDHIHDQKAAQWGNFRLRFGPLSARKIIEFSFLEDSSIK